MSEIADQNIQAVKRYVAEHKDQLATQGVECILAEYSGSGDSGAVDSVWLMPSDEAYREGKRAENSEISASLEALVEDILPEGFGDNDGGGGTFRIYLDGRIIHDSYFNSTVQLEPEEL